MSRNVRKYRVAFIIHMARIVHNTSVFARKVKREMKFIHFFIRTWNNWRLLIVRFLWWLPVYIFSIRWNLRNDFFANLEVIAKSLSPSLREHWIRPFSPKPLLRAVLNTVKTCKMILWYVYVQSLIIPSGRSLRSTDL